MSIARIDLPDPTYQRAWSVANAAERATLLASGPRRGDIIYQVDTTTYYLVVETGIIQQLGILDTSVGIFTFGRSVADGTWQNEGFNAGNFAANSSTWTVAAGNVIANRFRYDGKTLIWSVSISGGSTLGAGNTSVSILLPDGVTTPAPAGAHAVKPAYFQNAGTAYQDAVLQIQDSTHISIHRGGAGMAAGALGVYFTAILEID